MALSKSITLDNGAVVSYHVITSMTTDITNNQQSFILQSYVDSSAYSSNPQGSLDGFNFTMEGTNNTLDAAYTQVMGYDKYSGATTV